MRSVSMQASTKDPNFDIICPPSYLLADPGVHTWHLAMNGIEIRTKYFCNSRRVNGLLLFAMSFVFFLRGLFWWVVQSLTVNYGMAQGNLSLHVTDVVDLGV